MSLTFITIYQCVTCGHWEQGRQFSWGCRVNKNSIAITGSLIARVLNCKECDSPVAPTAFMYPDDDSAKKVVAFRQRKGWVAA